MRVQQDQLRGFCGYSQRSSRSDAKTGFSVVTTTEEVIVKFASSAKVPKMTVRRLRSTEGFRCATVAVQAHLANLLDAVWIWRSMATPSLYNREESDHSDRDCVCQSRDWRQLLSDHIEKRVSRMGATRVKHTENATEVTTKHV